MRVGCSGEHRPEADRQSRCRCRGINRAAESTLIDLVLSGGAYLFVRRMPLVRGSESAGLDHGVFVEPGARGSSLPQTPLRV